MNEKKIAVIIYKTDKNSFDEAKKSASKLVVPNGYELEILTAEGENKFSAYNSAMNQSDAKYKIYLDEHVIFLQKNILRRMLKIFQSNEKIGIIGVAGAIELSTSGMCLSSEKRCGNFLTGKNKTRSSSKKFKDDFIEVDAVDGFFLMTQYDLNWRDDIFKDNYYGDTAQCIEFKRKNFKSVIVNFDEPVLWFKVDNFQISESYRKKFLDEYSKDIFPLVTVIIPTFNRPKFFKLALDSALNQTYKNIEVFVSDNSTNDETEILMQEYLAKDSRIKYFRHKDFNANDNWNFCRQYNNPKAEYVNWLMDDDLFYPTKFEIMVEIYRNNPDVSLVNSTRDVIDLDGNITDRLGKISEESIKLPGKKAAERIFEHGENFIGEPTTVLIRKKFLRDNDLCWTDEEGGFFSLIDISTWLQLLTQGNMIYLAEPFSAFRRHPGQVTNQAGNGIVFEICWTQLFKTAWERKIFLTTEEQIRVRILNWIYSASIRLIQADKNNYKGGEILTLHKTMKAMIDALSNGYKFNLPPRDYGSKTSGGSIT